MAGLLTAIGLTEIYRLNPDDAFRQGIWMVIGVALFSATLVAFRHDYRRLESYKYVIGFGAIALLVLPALPGIGREIRGARLWVEVGPFQFQPGEFAKILLIVFLAGLPAREARGARAGTAEGLRPAAPDLGRRDGRARADERPRLGPPLLRDLPRDALRRDGEDHLRRRRDGALPRRARRSSTRSIPRVAGPRDDLARPLAVRERRVLPARAVALRDRLRRLRRHRARPGDVHDDGRARTSSRT